MKTYSNCYEWGCKELEQADISEWKLDARLLLEYTCGTNRNDLLAHGERMVEDELIRQYEGLIRKRAMHIPLQHITQVQEFMGLSFHVNENVLIPRQDTEILVEEVLRNLQDGMSILDMCTGSGCILISLLHYSNYCKGIGVDISEKALITAKQNADSLLSKKVQFHIEDITFLQSNLFEEVEGLFDAIVSNPPYIKSEVIETLMPEVKEFEPLQALDGKEDGLYFYREILAQCGKYLKRGGKLYFEIGYDQGKEVEELMYHAGFCEINICKDFAGLDRVVSGVLRKN